MVKPQHIVDAGTANKRTCRLLAAAAIAFAAAAGIVSPGVVTRAASAGESPATAPTYGGQLLPMNASDQVISPDGTYVAGLSTSYPASVEELHITPKGIVSSKLPTPGNTDAITSVSNDGVVAGGGGGLPPGNSGPGYPTPWVAAPGAASATGTPCLFYTVPDTNLDSPYSYCGYQFKGAKSYAYMAYRGESAHITGDGVVEGTSNCPPPNGAGACGSLDAYADPSTGGGCDICGTPASGLYSWSGSAKAALTPFALSTSHSWLLNTMTAVATNGDYAGYVGCDTNYPPQPPSAFPCPEKDGGPYNVDGWFVGSAGGDYTISTKTFPYLDNFEVNGINASNTVVGSWQSANASAPLPWEASGTSGWKQLQYPSSITIQYPKPLTEHVTGGAALAINDDGWVAGYVTSNGDQSYVAAMWTPAGKFVLLANQLNAYDRQYSRLRQAVGITAGGEILVVGSAADGHGNNTILLGPVTCSHIALQAPLSYRTGETVIHYHITGITLDCGPVTLSVDGHTVATLPDEPSTQSGEAVFPRRDCQPTVVAAQGDKLSEDDHGQGSNGKVLIAKNVSGPDGEGLRAGDELCIYENGARMLYDAAPQAIAASLKLTVAANGALAASTADLPESSVAGPGGLVVPSDSKVTQDIVDDPATATYASGGILGTTLRLGVGDGVVESATLPQVANQQPADLIKWAEQISGVQPIVACPAGGRPLTLTGIVSVTSAQVGCGVNHNNAALYGFDSSLEINGPVAGIGSIVVAGPLTVDGPLALIPASGNHYEGSTVTIDLMERDYSQPYMIFAPPKKQTVTQEPFDTGGVVLVSSSAVSLLGK